MDVTEAPKQWMDQIIIRTREMFEIFLEKFTEQGFKEPKYLDLIKNMILNNRFTLDVRFPDIQKYNEYLAITIMENYYKLYPAMCMAIGNIVSNHSDADVSPLDYFVSFVDVNTSLRIKELRANNIGELVRISGQVLLTYPLHPELIIGHFTCQDCQTVVLKVNQKFNYTEPSTCRNQLCANRGRFTLNINESRYINVQKIRIQDCQSENPKDSNPLRKINVKQEKIYLSYFYRIYQHIEYKHTYCLDIILKNENVDMVQAGDRCDFTGTLIVVPKLSADSITRQIRGDATERDSGQNCLETKQSDKKFLFIACSISASCSIFYGTRVVHNNELTADSIERIKKQMTEPQLEKINEMKCDVNLYHNLINSLFPTIHGNYQIKEGVLLMFFGGVPKTSVERTTVRGDINCCIVGDPSTVKSQLLIQVAEMFPCAVYISGEETTDLTADVVIHVESSDLVIKAGALVLADNSVCCIDEFDKIDQCKEEIMEAMKEQTISIAYEGVKATLNARTSILAAANPINNRYDRSKSLRQNVTLSRKFISHFDLFYVLIDECSEVDNCAITKGTEMYSDMEDTIETLYSQEDILSYISFARQFKPEITDEVSELLVTTYTKLKQYDRHYNRTTNWSIRVRHLESLTRLSEAMAKINCSDHVTPEHVSKAYSLLKKSIIRVEQSDVNLDDDLLNRTPKPDEMHVDLVDEPANLDFTKQNLPDSFEEYNRITNMLVDYIKSKQKIEIVGKSVYVYGGLLRSEIINWYLKKIEHQINDVNDLVVKKSFIRNILDRLIIHDKKLATLSRHQNCSPSAYLNQEEEAAFFDRVIVVNPNSFDFNSI